MDFTLYGSCCTGLDTQLRDFIMQLGGDLRSTTGVPLPFQDQQARYIPQFGPVLGSWSRQF